jgi:fatty acid amide hydrolase
MIHRLTVLELVAKLRSKELSATEIVEALIARQDELEPKIHAFAERFRDQAIDMARLVDDGRARGEPLGPLAGLPITIKENIATRGSDVTLGIKARRQRPAEDDAVVVKLLKRAGAIILGKTNIPQTLLFHEADNEVYGRTNNPWNVKRVPGGSSGGEAAAIASGESPVGVGTDIGGSIRVPAAFCGIFGLKPTLDRWSNIGCTSAMAGQEMIRSQCGPLARSARDLAFIFRALDSPLHAAFDPATPPMLTLDPSRTDVSLLRVGVYEDDRFFQPAASVRRAVREAAAALKLAGVKIIPFELPNSVDLTYLYFASLSSDGGKTLDKLLEGDEVMPQLKPLRMIAKMPHFIRKIIATTMASRGEARIERLLNEVHERSVTDYWALAHRRSQLRMEMTRAWDQAGLDAVLCPAHATPALWHGQSRDFSLGGVASMHYNTVNYPAGVAPVTRVRAGETTRPEVRDRLDRIAAEVESESVGLPVGVQLVARPYREDVVLALMIALEDAIKKNAEYPVTPVDPA